MKKRMNMQSRYLKLWSNNHSVRQLSVMEKNHDVFCKKAVDSLCLKVDMCETAEDYLYKFCEGMNELIELGVPKDKLLNHKLIFAKILRLGSDIIESTTQKDELFYIGLFIDMKISSCWYKNSFYKMIMNMLKVIKKKGTELPQIMKDKIINLVKVENYPLYALYFDRNALKNSA